MDELRSGKNAAHQVVAIQETGRLLALCDLLGAQQAINWPDLRFLADSSRSRFILVPTSGEAALPIGAPLVMRSGPPGRELSGAPDVLARCLGDMTLLAAYIGELDRIVQPGWLEGLLERTTPELTRQVRILRAEMPVSFPDTATLYRNRRIIRQMLRPADIALAYVQDVRGPVDRIAVANVHALPITIDGVLMGTDTVDLPDPVRLPPRQRDQPLTYMRIEVALDLGGPERPVLLGRVYGLDERRAIPLRSWISLSADK
jgi:hypothetical protein